MWHPRKTYYHVNRYGNPSGNEGSGGNHFATGNRQLALLKCSSVYPADPADMHLRTISDMKKEFGIPIGLSDHSMGSCPLPRR